MIVKAAKNYGNGIGTDGDLKAAYADAYDAADDHASYAAVYAADDDDSDDDSSDTGRENESNDDSRNERSLGNLTINASRSGCIIKIERKEGDKINIYYRVVI